MDQMLRFLYYLHRCVFQLCFYTEKQSRGKSLCGLSEAGIRSRTHRFPKHDENQICVKIKSDKYHESQKQYRID